MVTNLKEKMLYPNLMIDKILRKIKFFVGTSETLALAEIPPSSE
mgnify:CR=1 FL=1